MWPVPVADEFETWKLEADFQTLDLEIETRVLPLLEQLPR